MATAKDKEMSLKEKGEMIGNIVTVLRFVAHERNKAFDGGATFLQLCFMEDAELRKISKMCGL